MPYADPDDRRRADRVRYQHQRHRQGQATTRLGADLEPFRRLAQSRGLTVSALLAELAYAELDRCGVE